MSPPWSSGSGARRTRAGHGRVLAFTSLGWGSRGWRDLLKHHGTMGALLGSLPELLSAHQGLAICSLPLIISVHAPILSTCP